MQRRYCAACSADSRCNRFAKGLNQSYFSSINFQNASIRKQGCEKLALCNPAPSSSSINHCFLTCQHKLSGVRVSGQQPGWVPDIEHWFCHPYTRLVFPKVANGCRIFLPIHYPKLDRGLIFQTNRAARALDCDAQMYNLLTHSVEISCSRGLTNANSIPVVEMVLQKVF